MMDPSRLKLAVFFALLAAAVALGVWRDVGSRQRGVLRAVVVEADPGSTSPKSPGLTPAKIRARLADGRTIDVATKTTTAVPGGAEIEVSEWVTPWGVVWYKLNDPM